MKHLFTIPLTLNQYNSIFWIFNQGKKRMLLDLVFLRIDSFPFWSPYHIPQHLQTEQIPHIV